MTTQNTQSNKPSFVVGAIVHVWEPKGVRELKGGPSSSERTGGEYEDLLPTEQLKVVKKLGSTRALVQREDGTEILMHLNHINPSSTYYALRGAREAAAVPVAKRVEAAKAELLKKKEELEALIAIQLEAEGEIEAAAKEAAEEEETMEEAQRARDEAAALFEEAERAAG